MRRKAVVKEVYGDTAVIEVLRESMCEGCHNTGCAGNCEISLFPESGKMTASAENCACASVGDVVEIESGTKTVLGYAVIVFILPIIIAAALYSASFALTKSETVSAVCAVSGLVFSFCGIMIFDRSKQKKNPKIRIIKIL